MSSSSCALEYEPCVAETSPTDMPCMLARARSPAGTKTSSTESPLDGAPPACAGEPWLLAGGGRLAAPAPPAAAPAERRGAGVRVLCVRLRRQHGPLDVHARQHAVEPARDRPRAL